MCDSCTYLLHFSFTAQMQLAAMQMTVCFSTKKYISHYNNLEWTLVIVTPRCTENPF